MKIIRKMSSTKYIYQIVNNKKYMGTSKYTYGFMPFKINVDSDEKNLQLKQKSWLCKLLNSLPVLNLETFTPFYLYENGVNIGRVTKRLFAPTFCFEILGNSYTLTQNGGNIIRFEKEYESIVVFRKDVFSKNEINTYDVSFSGELDVGFILLLCVFIDVVLFSNQFRISYLKWEKDFVRPK